MHRIASIGYAAVVQAAAAEVNTASFLEEDARRIAAQRTAELQSIYQPIIEPAQQAGLCPESLTPLELHLGIGLLTRPLPSTPIETEFLPELRTGLLDTLFDGFRAQARAD